MRLLAETADAASTRQDVYSRSEVRYASSVDVPKLRAQAEEAAKKYRLLDTKIQQLNWLTELN
ncbi:DIP1984 family protein [Pauljensenia sp. UMB1177]|uniref:DIP1984 family protein n=1 Tax=Pauljensenia sp. UMB1177 TaxID=3046323 RepID=UPI003014B731